MGQALSRAEGAQQAAAASLFAGWQEKLIASALEGAMGGVWMLEDTVQQAEPSAAGRIFAGKGLTDGQNHGNV